MHAEISQSEIVKPFLPLGLLGFLIFLARTVCAQESAASEKIRDVSLDKKFATIDGVTQVVDKLEVKNGRRQTAHNRTM